MISDQALEQWSALVEREDAYTVPPPSSERRQRDGLLAERHSCPPAWREKICEWCYQVIDHCDIDRGVVSIALNYFDRFLSARALEDEDSFQLLAMTSLYLAAKLHSTRKISACSMSSLSKGCFTVDRILSMEICIMQTLRWHLNPPTPSIYLDVIEPLVEASLGDERGQASYEIAELSRYLVELGVCDSYFVGRSPSSVARASLLLAAESLKVEEKDFDGLRERLRELDGSPDATLSCARRLRHVYLLTTTTAAEAGGEGEEDDARVDMSPTSVLPEQY